MTRADPRFAALARSARAAGSLDDRYRWIHDATNAHRRRHHCGAYPFDDGAVLGAIAQQLLPRRVLELGTALGYTACWWADAGALVDTVEADPVHVELAEENIRVAGLEQRIDVHPGDFEKVLRELPGPYDAAFFDGGAPTVGLLEMLRERSAPGGVIVTTNLVFAGGAFRRELARAGDTLFVDDNLAITAVSGAS
jgi:predicted O-methyltransferase YrrM